MTIELLEELYTQFHIKFCISQLYSRFFAEFKTERSKVETKYL